MTLKASEGDAPTEHSVKILRVEILNILQHYKHLILLKEARSHYNSEFQRLSSSIIKIK